MKKRLRKFMPVVISVVLILVLIGYAPWGKVGHILADFDLGTVLILVGLSLLYYGLKVVRFWYLLQAMEIHQPLPIVALSYISAQPVSQLPAGEIYRSHALQQHTGIPVERSVGQFTIQGMLEGVAMASLMLVSAMTLGTLRLVALILAAAVLLSVIGISRDYMTNAGHLLNRLPFINFAEKNIQQFSRRNRAILTWRWLPFLYGLSLLTEIVGGAIAYTAVVGIGGDINIYQAVLVYIIPVIVSFISFLPGGIGLSEQSAVGVLLLSNVSVAQAVASTLIMRVTIVGLGVIYGVIALLIGRVRLKNIKLPLNLLPKHH